MEKKKILGILFLLFSVGFVFSDVTYHGNESGSRRVLIAAEKTRYKDQLVEVLIEKLDDGDTLIVQVDHMNGELGGMDPRDFDAVFITNSGAQARVRPAVMEWLASVRNYDDNVILHTTQITEWVPDVKVDSITSASKTRNIDTLSDDLVKRIKALFR